MMYFSLRFQDSFRSCKLFLNSAFSTSKIAQVVIPTLLLNWIPIPWGIWTPAVVMETAFGDVPASPPLLFSPFLFLLFTQYPVSQPLTSFNLSLPLSCLCFFVIRISLFGLFGHALRGQTKVDYASMLIMLMQLETQRSFMAWQKDQH